MSSRKDSNPDREIRSFSCYPITPREVAGREGIKPPSVVLETTIIIIIPTTYVESRTGFEPVMNTVLQTVAFDHSAIETFNHRTGGQNRTVM